MWSHEEPATISCTPSSADWTESVVMTNVRTRREPTRTMVAATTSSDTRRSYLGEGEREGEREREGEVVPEEALVEEEEEGGGRGERERAVLRQPDPRRRLHAQRIV